MKVRAITPTLDAWQYPAPELANLSAMPPWLHDCAWTGGDDLFVTTEGGEHQVQPGDWLVRLESGMIQHVRAAHFTSIYEVAV